MKQLLRIFLVLATLSLGGALAQATQPQPAALPALPTLVLPVGVELSDEELAGVEGKFWPIVVAYAVRGVIIITGAAAGAGTAVNSWATTGRVNWDAVKINAGIGFSAGVGMGLVQRYLPIPPRR